MLISAEVVPARSLNYLYIWLDIAFLVLFTALLVWRKKYLTVLFALAGGVLYFIVDYGIFYLALGTREVYGANPAAFLLWLSMSYGMTNFASPVRCSRRISARRSARSPSAAAPTRTTASWRSSSLSDMRSSSS